MYTSGKFTSDLVNSYAWDTAIVFAQTFDDRTDKTTPYSRQSDLTKQWYEASGSGHYSGVFASTGTNSLSDTSKQDKICNIWDMASNCWEWTTETSSCLGSGEYDYISCVLRGGNCSNINCYTSIRESSRSSGGLSVGSFRPLLYL